MNKVTVKIHGAEYPMVGEKSEKHMISVAAFVDTEMNKIGEANKRLSYISSSYISSYKYNR